MANRPTGNGNDQVKSQFTVDHSDSDPVEMPSVTKLLNRKKLGLSPTSQTRTITQPKLAPAAVAGPGQSEIQKVPPRGAGRSARPKLAKWTAERLAQAKDPFEKAVSHLIQKGARNVVVLCPPEPIRDHRVETPLGALCAYMSEDREELWRGLTLKPSMIPDVWQRLFTQGLYEIVPTVSLSTNSASAEFLKKAFALKSNEFLILLRCGAKNECTGILALVSTVSLVKEISQAFNASKNVSRAA